jgi:hypothetical protein
MSTVGGRLKCGMRRECQADVTHIDDKGYVYCREHGIERYSHRRCRQLTAKELRQLRSGIPLSSY